MPSFLYAMEHGKMPLCYNGDLTCRADIDALEKVCPQLQAVMIGRGLIRNPAMLSQSNINAETLQAFYDELLNEYINAFGGARNALFRMKEHWALLIGRFENAQEYAKQLRKTTDLNQYKTITSSIFRNCPLK